MPSIFELFRELLKQHDTALGYLETVLRYLAQVSNVLTEANLQAALQQALPLEIGEQLMPTLAETWHEQGLQKGIVQARQESRLMLIRQAHVKFGAETANALLGLLERINDAEQLAQVGEWILQCPSGEDLLAQVRELVESH